LTPRWCRIALHDREGLRALSIAFEIIPILITQETRT
jgi:hypothetical protein